MNLEAATTEAASMTNSDVTGDVHVSLDIQSANITNPPTTICSTSETKIASSTRSNVDEEDVEEDSVMSFGSDRRRAVATQLIRVGIRPDSPEIRWAQAKSKQLQDKAFDIDNFKDATPTSRPCTPPSDDPPEGPNLTPTSRPCTPPSDGPPEDPDPSRSPSPFGPSHKFYYKFYRNWSRYTGGPPEAGVQTAVDRVTTYRRLDEDEWKQVPKGFVVPRMENADEHEKDALVAEHQEVGIAAAAVGKGVLARMELRLNRERVNQAAIAAAAVGKSVLASLNAAKEQRLNRERAKQAAIAEGERERIEFTEAGRPKSADKKSKTPPRPVRSGLAGEVESADKKPKTPPHPVRSGLVGLVKPRLPKVPHEEGYQTPSESDLLGSDYAETQKVADKKRPMPSSDDDSDSSDGDISDTLQTVRRPTKIARVQPAVTTPARPTISVTPKSGRPGAKQIEFVKGIRQRFDADVAKAAKLFKAKEATILKQTGLGGIARPQEASSNLYNLFQSATRDTPRDKSDTGTTSSSNLTFSVNFN